MSEYQMGTMDISQHRASYAGFMAMTKYGSIAVIILLALLAIFVA
ncbi:aa3-type cytochrome c oxidase subunit IV [Ferrovibrio xuzhouensis]|uniref:Aa3-type cytochrome c oxidase subunit IV n=1 Tax=Ferrovibrio xuzhouensis TaxID=1576914 RepID=A0ABV7VB05_9PROT